MKDGVLSPQGPASLLDFDASKFLSYVESILRDNEEASDTLDKIYARPAETSTDRRREDLMAAIKAFAD